MINSKLFFIAGGVSSVGSLQLSGGAALSASLQTVTDNSNPANSSVLQLSTTGVGISTATVGGVFYAGTAGLITQSASTFFWDRSNAFLGLGTNTPISEVHVYSVSTATDRGISFQQGSTDALGARINLIKSRGNGVLTTADVLGRVAAWGFDGTGTKYLSTQISFNSIGTIGSGRIPSTITFHTSTDAASSVLTTAMTINQLQNVGIGVSPSYRFDVLGANGSTVIANFSATESTGSGTGITIQNNDNTSNSFAAINFNAGSSTYGGQFFASQAAVAAYGIANGMTIRAYAGKDIALTAASAYGALTTPSVLIQGSTSNVGINVSPSFKLDILGSSSSGINIACQIKGGTGTSAGGLKLGGFDATNGGFWSAAVVTPDSTNYALLADSTTTTLNAKTTLYLAIGGNIKMQVNSAGVAFNTLSLNASAYVQIDSTTKGFLPPRMTTAQKNAISSPAAGLVLYDTDLAKLCVFTTAWQTITSI